jgi:hypothetical protein
MSTSKAVKQQTNQTETQQQLTVKAPPLPATTDEAMDRHLAEWGGNGGRLFAFNGSTGVYRTLDDQVEVPPGTKFVALLHETRKGFIKFNDGAPPTTHMVRIDEIAQIPERETLGDTDPAEWPLGLNGEAADPWKLQFAIPMARHDAGGELYIYIARGPVAMNSAGDLLGRWRYHPKRSAGLIPVIRIESGTYPSKKFGGRKPKPMLVIDDWVTRTGESPPTAPMQQQLNRFAEPSLEEEMNDDLPDFAK